MANELQTLLGDAAATSQPASSAPIAVSTNSPAPAPSPSPTYTPSVDPNSASPYQSLSLPTVAPTGGVAASLGPAQTPPNLGAASRTGGIGYIADRVLRGALQGHQAAVQQQADQFNKKLGAQQQIYNDQAGQYLKLVQTGADPQSQEVKDAQNRAMASWQAMMQTIGSRIPQTKQGKSGSGQGKPGGPGILQQALDGSDPTQALGAWYQIAQQTGPSFVHQAAPYLTPAYQAKVQQRAATQGAGAETQQLTAENQAERQRLLSLDNPTEAQQNRIYQLTYGTNPKSTTLPQALTWKSLPKSVPFKSEDGQWMQTMTNPLGQTKNVALPAGFVPPVSALKGLTRFEQTQGGQWETYQTDAQGQEIDGTRKPISTTAAGQKPGAVYDHKLGRYVSAMIGPDNKAIAGTENPDAALPPQLTTQYSTKETLEKDENGQFVPITETTGHTATAPGQAPPAGASVGQPLGVFERTPEQTDAAKKASDALVNYKNAIQWAKRGSPTDMMSLLMAYTRSQVAGAGRMTETEIRRNLSSGSFGTRLQNQFDKFSSGTFDPEFVKNMVGTMGTGARDAQGQVQNLMKQGKSKTAGAGAGTAASTLPATAPTSFDWNALPKAAQ